MELPHTRAIQLFVKVSRSWGRFFLEACLRQFQRIKGKGRGRARSEGGAPLAFPTLPGVLALPFTLSCTPWNFLKLAHEKPCLKRPAYTSTTIETCSLGSTLSERILKVLLRCEATEFVS